MGPMNGRIIFESPFIGNLVSQGLGMEMIYSFVIIVCSLMIYFGTRELYELSSHKGIKYFRQTFLFFAIAYFFRSFIKFILNYFNVGMILDTPPHVFGSVTGMLTLFVFMYFSSIAIFYLLYSVKWKNFEKHPRVIYLVHFLAFVTAFMSITFRDTFMYLFLNMFLLGIVLVVVNISRKSNKKNNLSTIYSLLSFFWILNIIDILIPEFFKTFQLFIYLASLAVFLTMVYKVLRRTGGN